MTRKHFEYMAAAIANETRPASADRVTLMAFAKDMASKFGNNFDGGRFDARVAQYDSGERNPITYLNNH